MREWSPTPARVSETPGTHAPTQDMGSVSPITPLPRAHTPRLPTSPAVHLNISSTRATRTFSCDAVLRSYSSVCICFSMAVRRMVMEV